MASHSSVLAARTLWVVWKGKKIWNQMISTPGQMVSIMLLGKSRRQLLTDSERKKWWGQSGNKIKRCLLLWRKAMTNLDSVLKSRDITLPTKGCLVKAMVFLVGMYRCESWNIKKVEHWRTDAFKLWCWRRLLRVPWIARSNQSI